MADINNVSSDIDDVANRISDIIMSPATITGLINGALTVPLDMGYLAIGYFDTDSRFAHQTQRFRMAEAIHNDILNYKHITNAVEIIFKTSFCAVPLFIRVLPVTNSAPTTTSTG